MATVFILLSHGVSINVLFWTSFLLTSIKLFFLLSRFLFLSLESWPFCHLRTYLPVSHSDCFLCFLGCYECCLPCIRLSCTTHVTNNILINNLCAIFFSLFNKISPTFGSHSKTKIRGKKKRRKKIKRMAHAKLTFTLTIKAKTNVNTTFWSSHNFDLVGEVYFNRTNARVNNQLLWQSVL